MVCAECVFLNSRHYRGMVNRVVSQLSSISGLENVPEALINRRVDELGKRSYKADTQAAGTDSSTRPRWRGSV